MTREAAFEQSATGAGLHVILVANYVPDAQQGMLRFSAVLERELRRRQCDVSVLAPRAILGPTCGGHAGAAKWLGYADKFLLFPWTLRAAIRRARRSGANVIVHVCDHSNAMYTRYLRDVPHLVTCNDLLAVRSARGEIQQNPTRWSGRLLQRMILAGLNRAEQVACISEATRQDVLRLCETPKQAIHRIYMGLNYPYKPLRSDQARARIARLLSTKAPGRLARLAGRPFILHVGGNQWYKNRPGLLRIYAELKTIGRGAPLPALLMVGARFTPSMHDFVQTNGLGEDVAELTGVDNGDLEALYSQAELLLYPSLAEGFGWPVVEAMACGCRVVTSARPPLTELGGGAVEYIDPDDVAGSAATISTMLREAPAERQARVERGLRQQRRFSTQAMICGYLALYWSLVSRSPAARGAAIPAV